MSFTKIPWFSISQQEVTRIKALGEEKKEGSPTNALGGHPLLRDDAFLDIKQTCMSDKDEPMISLPKIISLSKMAELNPSLSSYPSNWESNTQQADGHHSIKPIQPLQQRQRRTAVMSKLRESGKDQASFNGAAIQHILHEQKHAKETTPDDPMHASKSIAKPDGTASLQKSELQHSTKDEKLIRKRIACRHSQQRSRARRTQRREELERNVLILQEKIDQMRRMHSSLASRFLAAQANQSQYMLERIDEYAGLYQKGLCMENQVTQEAQIRYLKSICSEDVDTMCGLFRGVDSFVEQWRLHHRVFGQIKLTVKQRNLHVDASNLTVVRLNSRLTSTLNRTTLQLLCPKVFTREDLVQQLLGQTLDTPVDLFFYFDDRGYVVKIDPIAHYLLALHELVDPAEDLSFVLSCLKVSETGLLDADVSTEVRNESARPL